MCYLKHIKQSSSKRTKRGRRRVGERKLKTFMTGNMQIQEQNPHCAILDLSAYKWQAPHTRERQKASQPVGALIRTRKSLIWAQECCWAPSLSGHFRCLTCLLLLSASLWRDLLKFGTFSHTLNNTFLMDFTKCLHMDVVISSCKAHYLKVHYPAWVKVPWGTLRNLWCPSRHSGTLLCLLISTDFQMGMKIKTQNRSRGQNSMDLWCGLLQATGYHQENCGVAMVLTNRMPEDKEGTEWERNPPWKCLEGVPICWNFYHIPPLSEEMGSNASKLIPYCDFS